MSVGAAPISPDELAALQAQQGTAPPPVGAPAPVYEGPAPPDFIDQTNAQPLAAPEPDALPPEPDATAWPPAVPAETPGMVPLAGAPAGLGSQPAAPSAISGAPAPTPGSPEAVTAAAKDADKTRGEADQAAIDLEAKKGEQTAAQRDLATERADNERLRQADNEEQIRLGNAAEAKAQQQIADAQAKVQDFKFQDYAANKGSARRLASSLAMAFGAYGASMTHTQNYALQILQKDMDDDHRNQVDQLQKLTDQQVMARTGLADARAARAQALTDIGVKAADFDRVIAAKADEVAAITTDDTQKARLSAFATGLKESSAQKLLETQQGLRTANLKDAEIEANTRLANAKADAGGFAYRHGRPGAGSGGGGVTGDAVGLLKQAIIDGKDGRPLNAAEIQDKANELKIPAFAKAGHPSVDAITKSVAFVAGQKSKADAAASKADGVDIGQIDKRAQAMADKELIGTQKSAGPLQLLDRMTGMSKALDHAIKTGDKAAAILALDEGSRMISGSAPTNTSTHLLVNGLNSARDELSQKWGKLTGDPGATAAFTGRIKGLIDTAAEEKRHQIDQIRERYLDAELGEHGFSRANPAAKERVMGQHARFFGSVTNANGTKRYDSGGTSAASAAPSIPAGAVLGKTKSGVRGYMLDGKFTAL